MGADTKIEWCHHTFNPWRGCTKISDGCKNCYAETLSGRNPKVLGQWGPQGTRVVAAESQWREPLRWDKAAQAAGERHRVFCASLADVFEWSDTMPADAWLKVRAVRVRLFRLIFETPNLDWLLLTKRPSHITQCIADVMNIAWGVPQAESPFAVWMEDWLTNHSVPRNVWLGTSVENQAAADERIPHLLRVPAAVRFLSCEPLLGPLDLSAFVACQCDAGGHCDLCLTGAARRWVIVGGESGPNARPMHPDWARGLRDQCAAAGVPFFFKQWGEYAVRTAVPVERVLVGTRWEPGMADGEANELVMYRVGKTAAGRMLDGRTWDEFPEAVTA